MANASGWIREHPHIALGRREIEQLHTIRTPTVLERALKALSELGRRLPYIGDMADMNLGTKDWLGITWSQETSEVEYLFHMCLIESRLVGGSLRIGADGSRVLEHVSIKPLGHAELEKGRQRNVDSAIGFCAMWYAPDILPVWTEGISPAIGEAGYEPMRIDNVEHNNKIDDEIVAAIRKSRFVVADFTGNRGGVYFEAGYALGRSIPVIWTVRAEDLHGVHFDNRQYNFIVWGMGDLPRLKTQLKNRIEATIGVGPLR